MGLKRIRHVMLTGTSSSGPGSWIVISESGNSCPQGGEKSLRILLADVPPHHVHPLALEPLGGGELGIFDVLPVGPQNEQRRRPSPTR